MMKVDRSTEGAPVAAANPICVSVVIPTYRRDDLLKRCLMRVLDQDFEPGRFEVIVVDDARSSTVATVLDDVRKQFPRTTLRLLQGERGGPAVARNIGWRAARGDLIAFIDDDAYPADRIWLGRGAAAFDCDLVVGASGTVIVPAKTPLTDFQRNVKNLERGEFLTCNAFYRRSALERVGGFDERFRVPFREDSDLQFRVEDSGGRMVRVPGARVVHPAPRGAFGVSLRLQRYSQYNALLFKKHPERFRAEIQPRPPLLYYATVLALLVMLGGLVARSPATARIGAASWAACYLAFSGKRVKGTIRDPLHLLDMALTSAVIPFLSIFWRVRGAVRYRVMFI